jgi:hypothetical protein
MLTFLASFATSLARQSAAFAFCVPFNEMEINLYLSCLVIKCSCHSHFSLFFLKSIRTLQLDFGIVVDVADNLEVEDGVTAFLIAPKATDIGIVLPVQTYHHHTLAETYGGDAFGIQVAY